MLRCSGGSLYTGITTDISRRFREHRGELPGGAKYTRLHPPEDCAAVWETDTRSAALRLERRIKSLRRAGKERLIADNSYLCSVTDEPELYRRTK
ncbi:MAG: GIY-YIG nuclease family protein [Ruminococcus sp.]|nr:GIY-YIG nuclease family protein [Ruminococcus sp.]